MEYTQGQPLPMQDLGKVGDFIRIRLLAFGTTCSRPVLVGTVCRKRMDRKPRASGPDNQLRIAHAPALVVSMVFLFHRFTIMKRGEECALALHPSSG